MIHEESLSTNKALCCEKDNNILGRENIEHGHNMHPVEKWE